MSRRSAPQPPPTTSSGVVGRPLRGGRAGRSGQPGRPYAPSRQWFEGETAALKGHIYDLIGSKSADRFITTTKQIAGYVGRTYTQGGNICLAVENLTLPVLQGPTAPTTTDALTVAIFREEVKEFVKRTQKLEEHVQLLWALLWGQASDAVRTKLEARRDHEDMRQWSAGVELLNAIKDLMYNVQELKYVPLAIHLARCHFYSSFQQHHVDAVHYLEQFNNRVDILERCGAAMGEDPVPCTRFLNKRASTPSLPTKRNCNRYELKPINGTLPWLSSWGQTVPTLDDFWKPTRMISCKVSTGTHKQGQMHSTSWPTIRKTNATTYELPGPTMGWHSQHVMNPTITTTHMRMTGLLARTHQRHLT